MPISENETLFQLLGTTYGGDGQSTYAVPDLRGRLPIHQGGGFILAETGGSEEVTLNVNQIPVHSHALIGSSSAASSQDPAGQLLATTQAQTYYNLADNAAAMASASIAFTGGSQPHSNFQPYLCVNFIISLFGLFPTQT